MRVFKAGHDSFLKTMYYKVHPIITNGSVTVSQFDILLGEGERSEVLLGNYAFVRGMVEAGVKVATCYPGSPTAEMVEALMDIGPKAGIYFEISTNEKVALEIAATSAIVNRPAVCWMKSVGLNVAADTAVQLSMMTMPGGLVVILGDDPGPLSSQNEQDNRHFIRQAYLPLLEPATAQEAKDHMVQAMALSQKLKMPVFIRSTTRTCHQTGPVSFGPKKVWTKEPAWDNKLMKRDGGYVPLPATVGPLKRKALENLDRFADQAGDLGLNRVYRLGRGEPKIRIITFGHAFQAVVSGLETIGAPAEILKLGLTHPLPHVDVLEFIRDIEEVHVMEELDPVLEQEVRLLAYKHGLSTRIVGKTGLPDEIDLRISEYTPTRCVRILSQRLGLEPPLRSVRPSIPVPSRSPQLCPGCGHRTAFYAAKQALGEGKEAFSMADIGCYSLGYLPPFNLGNLLYCMGSGAPAASAVSRAFPDEPVMSFVGDSTFFHAAMPGIANAVYNNHRQVIMVMDNGITAMTGHQPNPNSGRNARERTRRQSIDDILMAMGVVYLKRVPAYDCAAVEQATREAFAKAKEGRGGVAVVIQEEASALTRSKEERKEGVLPGPMKIDLTTCRNIRKCVTQFACPAIGLTEDDRTGISPDLCIGCGSCVQICPMITKPIVRDDEFQRV